MKTHGGATTFSDHHSLKPKKPKSREVSSRFLAPNPNTTSSSSSSSSSTEIGIQSPDSILSPIKQKPRSSIDSRKHKSLEKSGFLRGLWPSSSTVSPSIPSKPDTLADYLGKERHNDLSQAKHNQNQEVLNRQRSCTEFSRFEKGKQRAAKENNERIFGGSMKFKFNAKSLKYSNSRDDPNDNQIVPGRFSVDGIVLRNKSFGRGVTSDTESEQSDLCSGTSFDAQANGKKSQASYMAPTVSSRKHETEGSPRLTIDLSLRSRRWSAPFSPDCNSPKILTLKNSMKKTSSRWALSPGRSGSPDAGDVLSLKPPTSPPGGKGGVGNFLTMGIELLKGKKYGSGVALSPLRPCLADVGHELRLFHNRLFQWRYANSRAEAVNGDVTEYAERDFLYAWNCIVKLQLSVLQKKLRLQSEKLQMKLDSILSSQMKELERWRNMERQHLSAATMTNSLHAVVCRIPLLDGAKGEKPSVSFALRQASDVAASINFNLTTCAPHQMAKTVGLLVELATVVTQEKLLLEECLDLFRTISVLEVQESSLKSSIMQSMILREHQFFST